MFAPAIIAFQDGSKIKTCYLMHDVFIDDAGVILSHYYKNIDKVKQLISFGKIQELELEIELYGDFILQERYDPLEFDSESELIQFATKKEIEYVYFFKENNWSKLCNTTKGWINVNQLIRMMSSWE